MGRRISRQLVQWLAVLVVVSTAPISAEEPASGWLDRSHALSGLGDWREALARHGVELDLSYTGDVVANTHGGEARKTEYLGTIDLTLAWDSDAWFERDFGTFFVYGLWNHGGQPSRAVGDVQATDNIEAPDAIRLFEAWWQKTLLARTSLLVGLYDVNSEFYAIDSAELFLNGSFGMGGELGNSGITGPGTFPVAGWGAPTPRPSRFGGSSCRSPRSRARPATRAAPRRRVSTSRTVKAPS